MRIVRAGAAILYGAALLPFYLKYVPLSGSFQAVFLPVLVGLAAAAWADRRTGTLALIALFPLINGLPYYFGLYENVMHAPAALVLFLFYGLGRIGGWAFRTPGAADEEEGAAAYRALSAPLALWAAIVVVSALITMARYANFFPILSPGIFEWTVNRAGVGAGGAVMSVVMSALNHLTGIAFFLLAAPLLGREKFRRRALSVLGGATLAALLFGLFQRWGHMSLGNNRASAALGLINGTFKDALSFGAFLSMAAPLFAGVYLVGRKGPLRWASAGIVLVSVVFIASTGSKSGIIALAVSLSVFVVIAGTRRAKEKRRDGSGPPARRRWVPAAAALAIVLATVGGAVWLSRGSGIGRRFAETGDYASLRWREMWAPAARMMRDQPLSGVGEGIYIIEASNYSEFFARRMAASESAENLFVQAGAETGVIGFMALLWLAGTVAVRAWKGRRIAGRTGFSSPHSRPGVHSTTGSEKSGSEENYLLYVGAALGLLAFFINAQAHTYIGSFEIKYAFWFLAALVFSLTENPGGEPIARFAGPSNKHVPDTRPKNRKYIYISAAAFLLFTASHLWNSTHSLSIAARTERFGLRQEFGLGPVEKAADGRTFRWSKGAAGVPIRVDSTRLVLPLQAAHPDIVARPVRVQIDILTPALGGRTSLGAVRLSDHDWKEVPLDTSAWLGREALLLIRVSRTWSPKKMLGVSDSRMLGVALGAIR